MIISLLGRSDPTVSIIVAIDCRSIHVFCYLRWRIQVYTWRNFTSAIKHPWDKRQTEISLERSSLKFLSFFFRSHDSFAPTRSRSAKDHYYSTRSLDTDDSHVHEEACSHITVNGRSYLAFDSHIEGPSLQRISHAPRWMVINFGVIQLCSYNISQTSSRYRMNTLKKNISCI